ncbi:putative translation initiation factor eIF4E3 [Calycina marina]|uniref:Translation initiation factor eIF4E3 n=1 Tax=Calycina marina TaxID=1763456 RepID=A0A9P8CEJ1_9HELO|nr:putative translation initiation factor eIF4E3 [Calycina marina]
MDNLWTRRAQSSSKLSLSTGNSTSSPSNDHSSRNYTMGRKAGETSSHSNKNPFNAASASIASPTSASSAFGLGTGAFASFGAAKTPKIAGTSLDFGSALAMGSKSSLPLKDASDADSKLPKTSSVASSELASASSYKRVPIRTAYDWVIWCRAPTQKNTNIKYEDTIRPMCQIRTDQEYVDVLRHVKCPSNQPMVWEYHFFKEGIRPIWEDEENRKGGKWVIRLAKGIADRLWETTTMNLVSGSWGDIDEDICGAVVSMRMGEDVLSLWLRDAESGRNLKIKYVFLSDTWNTTKRAN